MAEQERARGNGQSDDTQAASAVLDDLESLRNHGRRVIRVHIAGDLDAGLASLADAVGATSAAR